MVGRQPCSYLPGNCRIGEFFEGVEENGWEAKENDSACLIFVDNNLEQSA